MTLATFTLWGLDQSLKAETLRLSSCLTRRLSARRLCSNKRFAFLNKVKQQRKKENEHHKENP